MTKYKESKQNFTSEQLEKAALGYANKYLKKKKLDSDEELQLVCCAQSYLFLVAASEKSSKYFTDAHKLIAKSYKKVGQTELSKKHLSLANSYKKI